MTARTPAKPAEGAGAIRHALELLKALLGPGVTFAQAEIVAKAEVALLARMAPAPIAWSREKPTVEGWYWYAKDGRVIAPEWVRVNAGYARWLNPGNDKLESVPNGLLWLQLPEPHAPIPSPEEPK